jgi:hypothetical protein
MRFASIAIIVAITAAGSSARADETPGTAECQYLEIAATTGTAPSIDPELKALDKKLKKPPFSAWNTFHKLSGGPISLAKQKPNALKLARGAASLLLRDRTDKKLELTVTIDGADGKRVLDNKQALAVGDWSVWGHSVKDDGHILALQCK